MLLHKAWLESRVRFLIGVGVVACLCFVFVLFHEAFRSRMVIAGGRPSYAEYVYWRVYGGFVRGIFLIVALVLGLGGPNGERTRGSVGFTLALPVPRGRLAATRALVGLGEVLLLALLPAVLVPSLSSVIGESYAWFQSLGFLFLWIAVGWVVFAAAFLASCLLKSDYSALTASILAFYIYPLVVARTAFLRPYRLHIHYIMNGTGMPYLDPRTHALVGPLPWTTLGVLVLVTAAFLGGGAMMLARMDFS